jgi:hypothetical protein
MEGTVVQAETQESHVGTSAGAVWGVLACNGPVSLDWLRQAAKLTATDANRGIGWLAREGKLSLERRARRREVRVAEAAEQVRQVLRARGPMLVVRAAQMAALPEDLAHQGLGWLAREGRVALRSMFSGRELEVGRAAGVVWRLVRSRGTMARKDIPAATGLSPSLTNEAIGWLVREGKLVVEDRHGDRSAAGSAVRAVAPAGSGAPQSDGSTRPKDSSPRGPNGTLALEKKGSGREVPIGEVAGSIWQALHTQGRLSADELSRATGLVDGSLDQGIGWLAREGKLGISRDRKGHEWFRLKDV